MIILQSFNLSLITVVITAVIDFGQGTSSSPAPPVKIGLCYLKLDKKAAVPSAFNDLINFCPNSDLPPKVYQFLISRGKF